VLYISLHIQNKSRSIFLRFVRTLLSQQIAVNLPSQPSTLNRRIAMKILVVENDDTVANALQKGLIAQQYLVEIAIDHQAGWDLVEIYEYDLILLDLSLPQMDGISFCSKLREKGNFTPILLLIAQEQINQKMIGLEAGADDYIVKPYGLNELLARIDSLLRRDKVLISTAIKWESLHLDSSNCNVTYANQPLNLTAKEYALLELFICNTHRIFSQSALIDRLWSLAEYPTENTVRAHVKKLRQKLKKAGAADDFIETVYGLGYRLKGLENQPEKSLATDQENHISPEFADIWERSQGTYLQRVEILKQVIVAFQSSSLNETLLESAQQEAHTLKGSLGSFGLIAAEQLASEIDQILLASDRLQLAQIEQLAHLVVALQQEIEKPVKSTPSTIINLAVSNRSARLLIIDDDTELTTALGEAIAGHGLIADTAANIIQARQAIATAQPDVILLDLGFPAAQENGLQLLAELQNDHAAIPTIVFTATENFVDRIAVARLGAKGFLQKPVSAHQILAKVAQILSQTNSLDARLLIVDDDPAMLDILGHLLSPWGFQLTLLDKPQLFWKVLEEATPDLLILDLKMPDFSGIDLCQVVRNDLRWSDLPILFLSAHTDAETICQVYTAGADDFVHKPIVEPELVARILNRLERTQMLRKLSNLL
jgi:DNA-binding response OmpR family regulator